MNKLEASNRSRSWISEFGPVCCGRVVRIDDGCRPYVEFDGNPGQPALARCLESVCLEGRDALEELPVLLVFDHGDCTRPIIVGIVESVVPRKAKARVAEVRAQGPRHALVDGRRVTLTGEDEVTLVCGGASITLTRQGRITLLGLEIVSRASGANKIRGASVSIN